MIIINEKSLELKELSIEEYLLLLYKYYKTKSTGDNINSLWKKGYVCKDIGDFILQHQAYRFINLINEESLINYHDLEYKIEDFEVLAKELIALYPKDLQDNVNMYYKNNVFDVSFALLHFFYIYGKYDNELIKDAVKSYINNFEEDYTYLKYLKNFIFQIDNNGTFKSELASYIETIMDIKNDKKNS